MEKIVEHLAIALYTAMYSGSDLGWRWRTTSDQTKDYWRDMARAAIQSILEFKVMNEQQLKEIRKRRDDLIKKAELVNNMFHPTQDNDFGQAAIDISDLLDEIHRLQEKIFEAGLVDFERFAERE